MMAANDTKSTKYRTLYRMNRAFDFITEQLPVLAEAGMLKPKMLRTFLAFNQELQSEINNQLLGVFQGIEERDWARFGNVRNSIEKDIQQG
jgi:hypothetical protein